MNKAANDFLTLHEIVKAARGNLEDNPWDYLMGGADTETTVKRNRQGLDSLAFRPRVAGSGGAWAGGTLPAAPA